MNPLNLCGSYTLAKNGELELVEFFIHPFFASDSKDENESILGPEIRFDFDMDNVKMTFLGILSMTYPEPSTYSHQDLLKIFLEEAFNTHDIEEINRMLEIKGRIEFEDANTYWFKLLEDFDRFTTENRPIYKSIDN